MRVYLYVDTDERLSSVSWQQVIQGYIKCKHLSAVTGMVSKLSNKYKYLLTITWL